MGLQPILGGPLFSMRAISRAPSQRCFFVDADAWCKRALNFQKSFLLGQTEPDSYTGIAAEATGSTAEDDGDLQPIYWLLIAVFVFVVIVVVVGLVYRFLIKPTT